MECKKEESIIETSLNNIVYKSDEYQELRLVIHDLAFKSKEIYQKADIDEKKLLVSQLFTNFTQNRYEIKPNYNLASQYLLKWVPRLNEAYEQQKFFVKEVNKGFSVENNYVCSELLGWHAQKPTCDF